MIEFLLFFLLIAGSLHRALRLALVPVSRAREGAPFA
jgi:hypothetical protein